MDGNIRFKLFITGPVSVVSETGDVMSTSVQIVLRSRCFIQAPEVWKSGSKINEYSGHFPRPYSVVLVKIDD